MSDEIERLRERLAGAYGSVGWSVLAEAVMDELLAVAEAADCRAPQWCGPPGIGRGVGRCSVCAA